MKAHGRDAFERNQRRKQLAYNKKWGVAEGFIKANPGIQALLKRTWNYLGPDVERELSRRDQQVKTETIVDTVLDSGWLEQLPGSFGGCRASGEMLVAHHALVKAFRALDYEDQMKIARIVFTPY